MMQQRDDERGNEQHRVSLAQPQPASLPYSNEPPALVLDMIILQTAHRVHSIPCSVIKRGESEDHQRNEKISNKSSFGIIDIAESSTTDRIIVIVDTACLIRDGAYR